MMKSYQNAPNARTHPDSVHVVAAGALARVDGHRARARAVPDSVLDLAGRAARDGRIPAAIRATRTDGRTRGVQPRLSRVLPSRPDRAAQYPLDRRAPQ